MKKISLSAKKILISSIFIILSLVIFTTSLFAWFLSEKTQESNILFKTGRLDVIADLFILKDFNNDGILDTDINNNVIQVKSVKTEGIALANCFPGEIFTYRLIAQNIGTISAFFTLKASNIQGDLSLNNIMSISYTLNNFNTKTLLAGQNIDIISPLQAIEITTKTTLILDFQIKFEHLKDLKGYEKTAIIFKDKQNLNEYKNKSLINDTKFIFEFAQKPVA